ncbi:hypothetical protein [Nostoc punctiforme]|uniref:Uncharacterized protein n=1 Tax=Nostoc punctiforme (strain ATCC 29133 / PCC 73102) TaxID=63737 RepID=B2J9J8_NOSP7|nr:hypothetical protein [Nostoc punctiforme]ACC79497.1 hypothetical protein Npun_F0745 [Nostoc punctiforme PCC 73102]
MENQNEKLLAQLRDDLATEQEKYNARLAEIKVKEQAAMAEKVKRQQSQQRVTETSNLLIQKTIENANLDPRQYRSVYERTFNLYGQQKAQELFVSSVIGLLTHKHTGVESATARFGNGGLTWQAKSFNSPQELYKAVLSSLHGEDGGDFDPLGGHEWFDVILDSLFEDPTFLPAESVMPERFTKYVQGLVAVNQMSRTNPIGLPDADDLTVDDMIYLQSLLGDY